MKVAIHCKPHVKWQRRYLDFFQTGFRRHGIRTVVTDSERPEAGVDFAVLFGPNYWKRLERSLPKFLMVNRKFIGDVNDNVAISWNGYNGLGVFCVKEVRETRLRRHQFRIDPWRAVDEGHVLLLGQYDLGRCGRYASLQEWHNHVRASTGDPILFRAWPGNSPLKSDCKGARCAVSLNSTVAIETVLIGLPTVAMHEQSPAWPVCAHHLGHVHRSDNRIQWLEYLANCQWHHQEIENGDFWRQLYIGPEDQPRLCDVEF